MYKKGTIVLIPFPFTDLSASKMRPAVIVSSELTDEGVVVAFISSKKAKQQQKTDVAVKNCGKTFANTGLKTDSIIKVGKIATLDKKIILGKLGKIDTITEKELNKKIKIFFGA